MHREGGGEEDEESGGQAGIAFHTVDASMTVDLFEVGSSEGQASQVALGSGRDGGYGNGFFVEGAVTRVEPEAGDALHTARGKLGFRGGGSRFVGGPYGTVDDADSEPDALVHDGGGGSSDFDRTWARSCGRSGP